MPSYYPPKKGVEYIFYVGLSSVATAGAFQSNPTIATGDCKVSIDGGTLNNLTTLPSVAPASSKLVKITLSAAEMNGDNIAVVWSDASGAETHDLIVNIHTAARQIDDLAYPTVAGRSIDVTATGEVGIDLANVGSPTTTLNLSGTTIKTATDVESDTADIQSRLPAALVSGRIDSSVGAVAANAITATSIATDAISAAKVASDAVTKIADAILSRSRSNVDDTASPDSLYELIATILDGDTSSGALVTKKTDGTTTFSTRTLSTNADAVPIVGVSGQ